MAELGASGRLSIFNQAGATDLMPTGPGGSTAGSYGRLVRVIEVWRYPVKSAQGESVPGSVVTDLGLEGDRQLAVVDVATGRALTARRQPDLLMLTATVTGDGVRLGTPDGRVLKSDAELSAWLGRSVHLARPPIDREPDYESPVDDEDEAGPWTVWTGPARVWHDSTRTRVSILSAASLGDWPVRRFRPNVLVDGAGEDDLVGRRIAIGSVVLDVTKRIDRCVMVTRPQPGGIERDLDVFRTVLRETDGFLGVGAVVATAGTLRVDDEVTDLGPSSGAGQAPLPPARKPFEFASMSEPTVESSENDPPETPTEAGGPQASASAARCCRPCSATSTARLA